ncbi:primosome assembly protein [Aliarcobacter butzleri JV22]|uniref:DEAD/DEAH box helicase family protein n=1 Tax=Aliarcobacter butzleri TaxID=28197 RepID=UPI0001F16320|nr:DEAD/DEAH box helicase family protein [Aliarcobacter butzleri]EFU69023.1 primosome assembly protein [Aliarcobacter butzleri JV22]
MYFYELALLKSPLENLTFQSEEEIKIGTKVLIKLKQRKALDEAVIVKIVEKPDFKCTDISEITNEFYDEKMLEIASFISTYYVCSLGEALSIYNPFDKNIKQFLNEEIFDSKIVLSSLQEKAKEFLKQKKQALLFANTGAGKTEIYIKIIEECLNSGKQAVLLMPEISLTPQMQKRLEKVFAKSVAIWHSKITKKKKYKFYKVYKKEV